jgi:hypothetical protein
VENLVEMNGVMSDKCLEALAKQLTTTEASLKKIINEIIDVHCEFSAFTSYHLVANQVYYRKFWPVCILLCNA